MATKIGFTNPKWWAGTTDKGENPTMTDVRFGRAATGGWGGLRCVTRLSFKVPNTGASHYSIDLQRVGRINTSASTTRKQVSYFIGRKPDECIDWGGPDAERTGDFKITLQNDLNRLTAEGDFNMLPGETLYLWLYNADTYQSYANYKFNSVSDNYQYIELSGVGGGIARISDGEKFDFATPYIWTNGSWQTCVPYELVDGEWSLTG